jgi:hypothetical protein
MTKTLEGLLSKAQAELPRKPSLKDLVARISQRGSYLGRPVAPVARRDRALIDEAMNVELTGTPDEELHAPDLIGRARVMGIFGIAAGVHRRSQLTAWR